ncbi:hypothetical protein, partial [Clostridioides difficile]
VCHVRYDSLSNDELIDNISHGLYVFEDNIDNELNKKEYFKFANDILYKYLQSLFVEAGTVIFNYEECINIKREIEKEIEEEKNDIDFL